MIAGREKVEGEVEALAKDKEAAEKAHPEGRSIQPLSPDSPSSH